MIFIYTYHITIYKDIRIQYIKTCWKTPSKLSPPSISASSSPSTQALCSPLSRNSPSTSLSPPSQSTGASNDSTATTTSSKLGIMSNSSLLPAINWAIDPPYSMYITRSLLIVIVLMRKESNMWQPRISLLHFSSIRLQGMKGKLRMGRHWIIIGIVFNDLVNM